jgi:hypothetical protein
MVCVTASGLPIVSEAGCGVNKQGPELGNSGMRP